ncbi:hypothetical protein PSN45_002802 [Yamadazyma tenuis]|uniref:Uncharacterized protein n=1 Tax=Candida tenuis (strain ATCC 10573 / BCRC 21748 / CBS 615 / JCM 9827 / NBRC 10315 / NRRL Y-1498 / VKM Y-70) TaxID=590646 RepID=G3AWP7_CANTC|nr:uncharacterized protein CANTEDRAFT_91759 [Yamadazyma tenuis ATCC 10573]EGV66587.1 hypothetical protein CANTEDRAFT_91759 [Yamadazyma tenuis ATCC 10573]WEJ95288.1 hypothetical protein PSN45_002802 [Yamadazyma tenuis]
MGFMNNFASWIADSAISFAQVVLFPWQKFVWEPFVYTFRIVEYTAGSVLLPVKLILGVKQIDVPKTGEFVVVMVQYVIVSGIVGTVVGVVLSKYLIILKQLRIGEPDLRKQRESTHLTPSSEDKLSQKESIKPEAPELNTNEWSRSEESNFDTLFERYLNETKLTSVGGNVGEHKSEGGSGTKPKQE